MASRFHHDHAREAPESIALAFKQGAFDSLFDFERFRVRLQRSASLAHTALARAHLHAVDAIAACAAEPRTRLCNAPIIALVAPQPQPPQVQVQAQTQAQSQSQSQSQSQARWSDATGEYLKQSIIHFTIHKKFVGSSASDIFCIGLRKNVKIFFSAPISYAYY